MNIGVVGAGIMGRGVSQVFAQRGYQVKLLDISKDILDQAKNEIYTNMRFHKLYHKDDTLIIDPNEAIDNIEFTIKYDRLSGCDFIIENVSEKLELKEEVYKVIDQICSEECIYAVNTSCISITQIGALVKKPSRVIGAHFMNPVNMIAAVEVIRGFHTSDKVTKQMKNLLESIDKEVIIVNDYPGFVANRISHLLMNEAAFIIENQVANPKDVDDIFKKCYGHKMGPLETADLIGIDTVVHSLDILYESYQDSKYRCCPLLRKMAHAGTVGRKSGQGFYIYE